MGILLACMGVVALALWFRPAHWWTRQAGLLIHSASAWKLAALLWAVVLIASILSAMPFPIFVAVLLFLPFWINEIRILLAASDEAFPGRNDKLIWALYLLFCPPIGVIFFRSFRERNWATAKPASTDWS